MPSVNIELEAFFAWLNALHLSRTVHSIHDISDASILFDLLSRADPSYFHPPSSSSRSDNWVIRLTSLKRLYRLITQYYVDNVLRQPEFTPEEEYTPDLQAIVKDVDGDSDGESGKAKTEAVKLLRLAIGIAVQGEGKRECVECIRELREDYQTALMKCIERVMTKFPPSVAEHPAETSMTDDDHYYQIQSSRSRLQAENDALTKQLASLTEKNHQLHSQREDLKAERDDALGTVRELRRAAEDKRNDKVEAAMRVEIERLKGELQKSEDNLSIAEVELEKRRATTADLNRKVIDLQAKAEEAVRLKDQVDEWRHTAERYQKNENVIEKYKRKLEETADLRRQLKSLTDQNTSLINANASLESEHAKVASFKPLLEAYKAQIAELEEKGARRAVEMEGLRVRVEEERERRREAEMVREAERREAEGWAERVRELEGAGVGVGSSGKKVRGGEDGVADGDGELGVEDDSPLIESVTALDDALSGTTMTDLKLRIRSLERSLASASQGDASRVMVLENLLEDANRMKGRYEKDYLAAHREVLVVRREMEEIRSGRAMGDGAEAALALRQRLNEVVDELDELKKKHEEQAVELQATTRDLIIARSDLNLVNKDQLDILSSLRESVSEDKADLERELERMRKQERELREKNRMQLEQVNSLLMEKVELQGEGIGQREVLLRRERDMSDLRASVAGKDLPEEAKARLLNLHEENLQLREQVKTSAAKLATARAFIKEQDALFNKQHADKVPTNTFEEAEASYQAQIKGLEETVAHLRKALADVERTYRSEQQRMAETVRVMGQLRPRDRSGRDGARSQPQSWLGQQRKTVASSIVRR